MGQNRWQHELCTRGQKEKHEVKENREMRNVVEKEAGGMRKRRGEEDEKEEEKKKKEVAATWSESYLYTVSLQSVMPSPTFSQKSE